MEERHRRITRIQGPTRKARTRGVLWVFQRETFVDSRTPVTPQLVFCSFTFFFLFLITRRLSRFITMRWKGRRDMKILNRFEKEDREHELSLSPHLLHTFILCILCQSFFYLEVTFLKFILFYLKIWPLRFVCSRKWKKKHMKNSRTSFDLLFF